MPETTKGWRNRAAFLSKTSCQTSDVLGVPTNFYPVSISLMFTLRDAAKPIASALAALFQKTERDAGYVMQNKPDGGGTETTSLPVSPELAKLRYDQTHRAATEMIDAIFKPETQKIVGTIIVDSLRDVFDRPYTSEDVTDFLAEPGTLPALPDLLIGLAKANKGVFGPLVGLLDGKVDNPKLQAAIKGVVDQLTHGMISNPESSPPPLVQTEPLP